MEEDSTNSKTSALESDFNGLPIPYHNMALTDNLPWLVHASELLTTAPVLSPGLPGVVRVRDTTNGDWWSSSWIYFLGHRHHPRELPEAI